MRRGRGFSFTEWGLAEIEREREREREKDIGKERERGRAASVLLVSILKRW